MTHRQRPPHFITGLGDGNVHRPPPQDDVFLRRRRRSPNILEHVRRRSSDPTTPQQQQFVQDVVVSSPWQVSAMALLCVMGLLLALFLHLMSDASAEKTLYKKRSPTKKKKTDEWNQDEAPNYNADSESAAPVYYPYRPNFSSQQQQHRHRKISGSGHTELNAAHRKSPVVINSRPYYHHNLSSSGAFGAPPKKQSPRIATTPRPMVRGGGAQPLSPVSSFASLSQNENNNNSTTNDSDPHSNLFLSPGTEDFVTPKAGPRRRLNLPPEVVETAVPFSGTAAALPFIPNLVDQQQGDSTFSPRSMEQHDTTIHRMESGDMTMPLLLPWEESSDALLVSPPKAYPGHPSPLRKNSSASDEQQHQEAAPRNNIIHKRKDLRMSTDAGSSLLSSIDFKELNLGDVIGGGGFGQVYKATWRGTPVAVKMLNAVSKSILEEFAAEINMLKGMRHPNICLYMGACLEPPNRAIVTELAANGSCWDALRLPLQPPHVASDGTMGTPTGTWPWSLIMRVACGAARGMTYLHSGTPPVLHRDLKSANLLLDDSYTTKVCDFGLSRLKAQQVSMTGNCGTVQWMAPEVLANQAYAEPADVYSFGIILWELLTRECPYDGMSAIQCALAVLNQDHRPEIPEWCPPALAALICACVEKDPSKRPTFAQIILALDAMS